MMKFCRAIVTLIVAIGFPLASATAAEKLSCDWFEKSLKNTPQPNIMLMGDSNFRRWPIATLAGATVLNAGRNGSTASLFWSKLKLCSWPKNPGKVFVMFGTNDSRVGPVPLATYEANLRSIVRLSKAHAPTVIVGILPHELPYNPAKPISDTNFSTAPYDAVAERVAAQEGVRYIKTSDKFPASGYTSDGIHLNASGYAILQGLLSGQPS